MGLATTIAVFWVTLLSTVPGHAEKRVALLIGNGAYERADQPANPVTDARRMRDALSKLGFDVVFGENLAKQALERTIGRFANTVQHADVALVYFAGHGATFGYESFALVSMQVVTAVSPVVASPSQDLAGQAWSAVKDTNSVAVLEEFRRLYPNPPYGTFAAARIDELKKQQTAAVAPPVPPVVRPLVVPSAAAGPCGGVSTVSLLSRGAVPLSAAEECALKPKDSFRECANCPELVVVPAGSFTMGSPESEKDRRNDEGPQHRVTIGKPFAGREVPCDGRSVRRIRGGNRL